jgi:hypothetical protein
MRKWELWENREECSSSFFPDSAMKARVMAMADGEVKTWETEARSSNDAMRALHEHRGWDPYQPMLRYDGTPYPEDEDNDLLKKQEGEFFDAPWSAWCPVAQVSVIVPCDLDAADVLRHGGFEWVCSACGQSHNMKFQARKFG